MNVTLEMLYSEIQEVKKIAMMQLKESLTMEEAAVYSGLSKSYLYTLVWKKKIPFFKSQGGGKTYFKKSDLDAWLLAARYDTISETEDKYNQQSISDIITIKKGVSNE